MKILKQKILLGIPIAFLSFEAFIGAVFGYLSANFFSRRMPSILFDIGNYRLHLHHWLLGMLTVILAILFNFLPLFNSLSFGFLGGLIFQGIADYSDWHKIIFRK